jgi:hypothetical protein
MEVSGQLHAPSASPPEERTYRVSIFIKLDKKVEQIP